jgi:2,5-diamino-6-(ribosylamino)-4(3H)-pyrimidinone 5'-phosphate reductase
MNRPYVICHMCTTIDGKVLADRWSRLAGGKASGDLFETTAARFGIGAWLVGTTTMKEFAGRAMKLRPPRTPISAGDFIANPKATSFAIGIDAKGVLRFQSSEVDGDHVVLLVTEQVGAAYRAHLRTAGVSYLVCGANRVDLPRALNKLHKTFGLRQLMLEGGGRLNGSMLQAGLVDEISQVVIPIVDGGGPEVTGIFDPPGKPPRSAAAHLRVLRHQSLTGGVHWFRYRVERKRGMGINGPPGHTP